jgi:hypothetical protein
MGYQRLEVNLLPPELAPPPPVRLAWIINAALILFGLGFIAVHFFGTMIAISAVKKDISEKDTIIASQKPDLDTYNRLEEIRMHTEGRGKLVGMASSSYVEYPVVLERISRIVPPGVYLVEATSASGKGGSDMRLQFRASRNDPALLSATLEAFKVNPMFRDTFMRTADYEQEPLGELADAFNIPYGYSNPDSDELFVMDEFAFEIHTKVNSPVAPDDLVLVVDRSDLMTEFEVLSNPANAKAATKTAPQAGEGEGAAKPAAGAAPPAAAGGANANAGGGQ